MTFQQYIEKLNKKYVKNLINEEIMTRYKQINKIKTHNRQMFEFRMKRNI